MPETIMVIPCYNEDRRLDVDAFRRFAQTSRGLQFMLVDDGSTDGTPRMLYQLQRADPARFSMHRLPRNEGKAEAVRQGMLRAIEARPQLVGYWDADLATPLCEINQFRDVLRARPECQLVMGSRVALLGRRVERRWSRHVLGRLFATAASVALGLRVYDTQCGAKMFRVSPRLEAVIDQPFQSRWIFDVELLARLTCGGLLDDASGGLDAVVELPLDQWRDVSGSKLRPADFVRAAWELAAIHRQTMRGYRRRRRQVVTSAPPAPQRKAA